MSAAQPARSVAADLATWVLDAGRAVGESTIVGRVLHGPDGGVETVVDDPAVRLGRRREHLGRSRLSRASLAGADLPRHLFSSLSFNVEIYFCSVTHSQH